MSYREPVRDERASLLALIAALDVSPRSLRRDDCGHWAIIGKLGHILVDGQGYLLYVATGESARRWFNVKQRLAFCHLKQDGNDEGCLCLGNLPTKAQAGAIREALAIRKRRNLSPAAMGQAISALEQSRAALNGPLPASNRLNSPDVLDRPSRVGV
jgi:hypothetical protein